MKKCWLKKRQESDEELPVFGKGVVVKEEDERRQDGMELWTSAVMVRL